MFQYYAAYLNGHTHILYIWYYLYIPNCCIRVYIYIHLESHKPIFFVITALIVWSHLCESCYGFFTAFLQQNVERPATVLRFLRFFFNKMFKKCDLATGRVGLQCSFDLTIFCWSLQVKTLCFFPKKLIITAFSHDQKILCFWFSTDYVVCTMQTVG